MGKVQLNQTCEMDNMGKFCVKQLDKSDGNIREYFRKMREDEKLFDVTLATEDGKRIEAHKIILSAESKFFADIFVKSDHPNMLIYLRGIHSHHLQLILDFIYKGEVSVAEEEIKTFSESGKCLEIKGLEAEFSISTIKTNEIKSPKQHRKNDHRTEDEYYEYKNNILDESGVELKIEIQTIDREIDDQIQKMIVKTKTGWKCKVCGRRSTRKQSLQRHAETHIVGESYCCRQCDKSCPTRPSLKKHISRHHKKDLI